MCYACDTLTSGLDCVYTPENLTIANISTIPCRGYCTIERREYAHIPGIYKIRGF